AAVDVGVLRVEVRPVRPGGVGEVAAGGVDQALRPARRTGRVDDEQRVLGVEGHGLVLGARRVHGLVPPHVPAGGPADVVPGAAHDEDVLEMGQVAGGLVGGG